MDTTLWERFLVLDRGLPTSLHEQLYEGLRKWVNLLQPGQRLPAERELATLAKVDRSTVKSAISRLVREKAIMRNVKGTFKAKSAEDFDQRPHPFAFSANAGRAPAGTILRLVLFENLPIQRVVWAQVMELFNQSHPSLRAEIEWLPVEVDNLAQYAEYIRSRQPDVVQLSKDLAFKLSQDDLLAPLPDDLAQALRGDAYHSEILCPAEQALLLYAAPLEFCPWGVLWNEDLVGEYDATLVSNLTLPNLTRWLAVACQRLPRKYHLLAEPWYLPFAHGFPAKPRTEEALQRFFIESFAAMEVLQGLRDRFLWTKTDPRQNAKLFLEGHVAFYLNGLNYMFTSISASQLRWQGAWVVPEAGCNLSTSWSGVGTPRAAAHPGPAAELVRFLASPQAQDEIAIGRLNAAFLRASNRLLPNIRCNSEANRRVAFQGLYSDGAQTSEGQDFVGNDLRFLYREVMEDRRTVSDAVGLAMEMTRRKLGRFKDGGDGV